MDSANSEYKSTPKEKKHVATTAISNAGISQAGNSLTPRPPKLRFGLRKK